MDFIVNITDSAAPPGVYYINWHKPIKRGDLVLLRNEMKLEVGLPNDKVCWSKQGVSVNGKMIKDSQIPADSPYPPFPYQCLTLADGQYVFMGNQPLSFDGRYQGPLPQSLIEAGVTKAWVF